MTTGRINQVTILTWSQRWGRSYPLAARGGTHRAAERKFSLGCPCRPCDRSNTGANVKITNTKAARILTNRIQLPRLNSFYLWSATTKYSHARDVDTCRAIHSKGEGYHETVTY